MPVIGFPRLAGVMLGDYGHSRGERHRHGYRDGPGRAPDVAVPRGRRLQGNLDPLALAAGGQAMRARDSRLILLAMRGPAVHLQSGPRRSAADLARARGALIRMVRMPDAEVARAAAGSRSSCSTWAARTGRRRSRRSCAICSPTRRSCACPSSCGRFSPGSSPRARVKPALANYALLGGKSPLLEQTEAQARALEAALPELDARCFIAMRYWHPFSAAAARAVRAWGPDEMCCCRSIRNSRRRRPAAP